ncbi:MAG TPA: RNA polymerase sigma-70 factor [Ktedonobacteraceae bacterium]|nr:RNA polymerase sigma-70 factor [Ktedonobacteraceae bacterium]
MTLTGTIITDEFEGYRPYLFSIAYRMMGSASEAEDIVQDTYLRYLQAPSSEIRSPKSYLATLVTRLCIDHLRSARIQREEYIGPWLPEPLLTSDQEAMPFETAAQHESISLAFLVLLETLSPPERAVFLLHDIFAFDYQEIAGMIGRSPTSCRQLGHRARASIASRKHRYEPSRETHLRLLNRFLLACQEGDVEGLKEILAQDVVNYGDGGGKVLAALRPVVGIDAVMRLWLSLTHKALADLSITFEEVNGQPAVISWRGERVYDVVSFEVVDARIQAIRGILNPDKLTYIARQLQAHTHEER